MLQKLTKRNDTKFISLDKLSAIEYTIDMEQRFIKIAQLSNGKIPFIDWMESLDKVTKSRVQVG